MHFISLYSILFYSILFYSILFYGSILFYFILSHFILTHSILSQSIPLHSTTFFHFLFYSDYSTIFLSAVNSPCYSILLHPTLFLYVPFPLLHFIPLHPFRFYCSHFISFLSTPLIFN